MTIVMDLWAAKKCLEAIRTTVVGRWKGNLQVQSWVFIVFVLRAKNLSEEENKQSRAISVALIY